MPHRPRCVVLVPAARGGPDTEAAVGELVRRAYPVLRAEADGPVWAARDGLAAAALAAGYDELLWVDPDVVFDPDDVDWLRARGLPVVGGICPVPGRRAVGCDFLPGTAAVRFGRDGGPLEVRGLDLGFALTRRAAFDAVAASSPGAGGQFFAPPTPGDGPADGGGRWFCERVRAAGMRVVADTAVRVWRVGPYRYGWEDAGRDPQRFADYTFHVADARPGPPPPPVPPAGPAPRPTPPRCPLRGPARPRRPGPPRVRAYVVTYPANRDSLAATLASFRASDWGEVPVVVDQPADWPPGGPSAPANYKRALQAAAADGVDFALIAEDDVRVGRHLRHNLLALPLVGRDQCDYLSLFMPDLVADPWARAEPHLGYRLATPRITGPDRLWEKHRLWGAQGVVYSRRLLLAALSRWDALTGVQDTRLLRVCDELRLPLYYAAPCWVDHAPVRSGYGTPPAYAADYVPDFRLTVGPGYHPPEAVPGWLTAAEGRLLWEAAAGRAVLEVGAGAGRATVCLAQSAARVVAVDAVDGEEAGEWCRRFAVAGRVEFRADAGPGGGYGLGVVAAQDAAGLARDLDAVAARLAPGGVVACQHYPDPAWPDVRRVVDGYARRLGWRRVGQADYLGVFQS